MINFELVKVIINFPKLARVILNMVFWHYGMPNLTISNRNSLFIFKFWSLLCYFLGIKQMLLIVFYAKTDSQIKQQNSIIEAYLQFLVKFK